ncbi:MAG TPA: hypothetical protein VGK20_18185 [Candidatus Binatia bacterium]|jgi:hypothetical protein
MKRTRFTLAATLCFLTIAGIATAKDICVIDTQPGPAHWHFYKPKGLKPGSAIALNGVYAAGFINCPVTGTALLTTGGQVRLGVTVHCGAPIAGANLVFNATGTPDFTMTGSFDTDWDGVPDFPVNWVPEDCATAPAL